MNQLWNVGNLRDFWLRWTPAAVNNLSWLNSPDCFRPKFFAAPLENLISVPANGYLITTFQFVPGSWLVGLSQVNATTLDMQLTDLVTNYKFFSAPVSVALVANTGAFTMPWWLPEPYMFPSGGIFGGGASCRVELWNNSATPTVNSQLVLHVMEPVEASV